MTNQTKQEALYLRQEIIYLEKNEFENSNTSKSNEVLLINKLKDVETLPKPNVTKLIQTPVIQTTPLENMCVLQNRIQYGKRRRLLNRILSESYVKKNKNECTCKVQVKQKHKLSHNVLLRRLRILSHSKRNNKLFCERIENVKVLTYIDISSDDLSDEETKENVKGKKKKDTNYTQTSEPYTAVTKSSDSCRTFCEEILPTTHVLSDEETVDNARRKKGENTNYVRTSEPYTYSKHSRKKRKNTNNYIQTSDTVIQISKPFTAVTNSSDDCRTVTFCGEILPTTHHVLSDEETVDSVRRKKRKNTNNYIQTSEPYTAVTKSSYDCTTVTFSEEIIPTTHHVLSGEETVSNVIQTSDPYTSVTKSTEDCGTLTFCDEKIPTLRLKIQDFENKKFRKLLQYLYEKLDLKVIETMSYKEFNVIVIIENEKLQLTDIFITDKNNIITEIATAPFNDYSYIYNLYDKSNNSNNLEKLCCNVLRLQCCCWHNRQKQIELKFPKDFKRFLFIPHSCLNSCSCCCNENGKEFVSEKQKQTNNLSAADITTPTQTFSSIQIPQNTLQAKALSFKKPKYKQSPDSFTESVQSHSSLSLQFHFETNLKEFTVCYKQLVETIEFGNKGEILFHDYHVETNSMCLVRLDIKYVILTQGIITDNICCKYKYEVVLEKLKLVFKIEPNILTYIRNGHKDTLSIHLDICNDCKLSNNKQTIDLTKNLKFKHYGRKVNLPIEHSRKAIVSRAVKPILVMGEQIKCLEQIEHSRKAIVNRAVKPKLVMGEQTKRLEQKEHSRKAIVSRAVKPKLVMGEQTKRLRQKKHSRKAIVSRAVEPKLVMGEQIKRLEQIEHSRKAIVSRAVKPKLVMGEQTEHLEHTETLNNHVPINIILKTVPTGSLLLQVNPNEKVKLIMPVQGKSSKAIQRLNYLETASSCSILKSMLENNSQEEILLPKITEVYSLKESNVIEEIDSQVDVKSEIDIEEHELQEKIIK